MQLLNGKSKTIICVLPPCYSANSNGITTLCTIYKELQKSAPTQTIFICKESSDFKIDDYKLLFGTALKIYTDFSKLALLHTLLKNQFILVRPDDLEGIQNEIHWDLAEADSCKCIVNILLAPPFAFSSKISITNYYGKKDLFILCNQAVMPAFAGMEHKDRFIESKLDSQLINFYQADRKIKRSKISVYIGKGIVRSLPTSIIDSLDIISGAECSNEVVLIKRSWPVLKNELYSILSSSKILISFDPFSHIERVATYLGTPVLKLCRYNIKELPGVFVWPNCGKINVNCLPSEEQIHLDSEKSYHDSLQTGKRNLNSVTNSIISASCVADVEKQLSNVTIPFSKHCMYAFSSQFRNLLPYMGALSMASLNESLNESDLIDLMTHKYNTKYQSRFSKIYATKRRELPSPSPFSDLVGFKQAYYQYKHSLVNIS